MTVAAVAGAVIGRNFARVSCLPPEATTAVPCPGREVAFGVVAGLVAALGVAVVIYLAIRSLTEWREYQSGDGSEGDEGKGD